MRALAATQCLSGSALLCPRATNVSVAGSRMSPSCYGGNCAAWGISKVIDGGWYSSRSLGIVSYSLNPSMQLDLGSTRTDIAGVHGWWESTLLSHGWMTAVTGTCQPDSHAKLLARVPGVFPKRTWHPQPWKCQQRAPNLQRGVCGLYPVFTPCVTHLLSAFSVR